MNGWRAHLGRWGGWHELALLLLIVGLLVVAGILMPSFLQPRSQLLLSRHLWELAILALGMTLIIIAGGIDLSIGSAMGLCAVSFGMTHAATGSVWAASAICLLTGTLCGLVNGTLIARLDVHPLIVTLATFAAYRGTAEGLSQGASYSRFGDRFGSFARTMQWGLPLPGYLFVALLIGLAVWLNRTPTGRFLYAIGHNERAARFSGIRVGSIRVGLYTFMGALAGLVTLIYVARFDTAKADAGRGFELDVITAVVVGGTSIFGGRGTLLGTTLGVILIHETRQFVARYWRSDEWTSIVIGLLLIVSVLVYRLVAQGPRTVRSAD